MKQFLDAPVAGGTLKDRMPPGFRRAYRRLKYAYLIMTSGPRMRTSGLPFEEVTQLIARCEADMVAAVPDESHGLPAVRAFAYWVTKRRRPAE